MNAEKEKIEVIKDTETLKSFYNGTGKRVLLVGATSCSGCTYAVMELEKKLPYMKGIHIAMVYATDIHPRNVETLLGLKSNSIKAYPTWLITEKTKNFFLQEAMSVSRALEIMSEEFRMIFSPMPMNTPKLPSPKPIIQNEPKELHETEVGQEKVFAKMKQLAQSALVKKKKQK